MESQRLLGSQAAADVHYGGLFRERSAIIAPTITAWHNDGADHRHANLAAVNMAAEHQVDPLPARPGHVVRRVAQAKTKPFPGRTNRSRWGFVPGPFIPNYDHRLAAERDFRPSIVQDVHAQPSQTTAKLRSLVPCIL